LTNRLTETIEPANVNFKQVLMRRLAAPQIYESIVYQSITYQSKTAFCFVPIRSRMTVSLTERPKMNFSASRYVRPLHTNGFRVLLPEKVNAIVHDFPDPSAVKTERRRLQDYWFLHWVGAKLYYLRLKSGGPDVKGKVQSLYVSEHPWLLRARLDDVIGQGVPRYDPIRARPFTFLAQKAELIETAAAAAGVSHPLLADFKVTPRFVLNAKIYEDSDGVPSLGIFVTVGMQHDIQAPLGDLQANGLDVTGMHVVRRIAEPGKRHHMGRIGDLKNNQARLVEPTDLETVPLQTIKLEGSKENFAKCLTTLLGGTHYKALTESLDDAQANYLLGPHFDPIVEKMGALLAKTPLQLAHDVEARIAERIVLKNSSAARNVYRVPQIDYVFDRTGAKSAAFAWPGLAQFGPYDRATFANKSPRLLVVFPASTQGKVEAFLKAFRDGMGAGYRDFARGFSDLFGLVNLEFVMCPVDISIPERESSEAAYRKAIEKQLSSSQEIHGGIVVLFDEHAFLKGLQNPYIRTKALLLTLGIPTQEVRMRTINQPLRSLQYTLQNFSISVYAKLNGTPWTVNQDKAISDELVVGMGFAELSGSRSEARQRFVGITTVFGGDGTYLLGNVSKECDYSSYPRILQESIRSVLSELRIRNNWQPGDTVRVVFHAHRPLKRVDIAGIVFDCMREVGTHQKIQMAFATVSHDHPFYILDRKEQGEPVKRDSESLKGVFAPARGTIARIGRSTRLVALNSGKLIKRQNTPLPAPLLISLHPDSTFTDIDYVAEQALKFTSLSWRSTLPAHTPVTIYYSERIAELLGHLKDVPDWSPTALSVRLKWSRWFL